MESEIFAIDSELMVRFNSFNIFSCIFHFMVSFNSLNISSHIYIFGCTFLMVGFFSLNISSIGGSWPPPLRLHRRLPGKLHGEERSRGDNLASRLHLFVSSDPGRNTSAELPNKIVTKHKNTQFMLQEFPRTNNYCRLFLQEGLASGHLAHWTKGFKCSGVEVSIFLKRLVLL